MSMQLAMAAGFLTFMGIALWNRRGNDEPKAPPRKRPTEPEPRPGRRTHGRGAPPLEDAKRIARESREIIQGRRRYYSDAPGRDVTAKDAAKRLASVLREAKGHGGGSAPSENQLAIDAARRAAAQEIFANTKPVRQADTRGKSVHSATPSSDPPPAPGAQKTPPGFDRSKASNSAKDIAKHLTQKQYNYNRKAMKAWQTVAGIVADGLYGPATRNALLAFTPTAPKALFKGEDKPYPWG